MANIIDGKAIAADIRNGLKARVLALKERGVHPCLAVILAGENPASEIYVRNKNRACDELGIEFKLIRFPSDVTQTELAECITSLNADLSVHAMLVQLPLPNHIDSLSVLDLISPEKDADGFHVINAGRLLTGRIGVLPGTPAGCMELIRSTGATLTGLRATVIGRSNIVGKPMALLLLNENCTVTICHSRTQNLADITRESDIIVAAVGVAGLVTGDMVKPGAIVIDVGMNRNAENKLVGDVDFASVEPVAGYITPVPGGVGPMTVAMLMRNTVCAAENSAC